MTDCQHQYSTTVRDDKQGDVVVGWWKTCSECHEEFYVRNEHWDRYLDAQRELDRREQTRTEPPIFARHPGGFHWYSPIAGAILGVGVAPIINAGNGWPLGFVTLAGFATVGSLLVNREGGCIAPFLRSLCKLAAIAACCFLVLRWLPYLGVHMPVIGAGAVVGAIVWAVLAAVWG